MTGSKRAIYTIIRQSPGVYSTKQLQIKTGYRSQKTIFCSLVWLLSNGYIRRNGTGNGRPYYYEVNTNVLDS